MTKKSQAFLEFMLDYGWAILVVLAAIAALAYFGVLSKEPYRTNTWCGDNPDKCVCEEAKPYCNKGYSLTEQVKIGGYFNNSLNSFWYTSIELQCCKDDSKGNDCQETKDECLKFRKKTQSELDIDDCNNNPREDEKCKCEEWCYNSLELEDIVNIKWFSRHSTQCFTFPEEFRNFKIINSSTSICLKSHPKTDYEKHPEDYVAETKEITTCADPDRNANGSYQVENCGEYNISQTTYRLKNECEKKHFVEGKIVIIPTEIKPSFFGESYQKICQKGIYEGEDCYEGNPDWVEEKRRYVECDNGFKGFIENNQINVATEQGNPTTCDEYQQTICQEKTK